MEDVFLLIKRYQSAAKLDDRLCLGETILDHIAPDVRIFLMGRMPPDAVVDTCQETLAAIARGLLQFAGTDAKAFYGWAYRIAHNKMSDFYRKRGANARVTAMAPDELQEVLDKNPPEAGFSTDDRLDLEYAMNLLASAKPDCREFLWAHFVAGFDYTEIAQKHGISYDSARMRINRCLEIVRDLLEEKPTAY